MLRKWGLFPGPFRARTEKNEGGDFPQHGERSSILQGMYVTIRQQRRSEKRELRERASSSVLSFLASVLVFYSQVHVISRSSKQAVSRPQVSRSSLNHIPAMHTLLRCGSPPGLAGAFTAINWDALSSDAAHVAVAHSIWQGCP